MVWMRIDESIFTTLKIIVLPHPGKGFEITSFIWEVNDLAYHYMRAYAYFEARVMAL